MSGKRVSYFHRESRWVATEQFSEAYCAPGGAIKNKGFEMPI